MCTKLVLAYPALRSRWRAVSFKQLYASLGESGNSGNTVNGSKRKGKSSDKRRSSAYSSSASKADVGLAHDEVIPWLLLLLADHETHASDSAGDKGGASAGTPARRMQTI